MQMSLSGESLASASATPFCTRMRFFVLFDLGRGQVSDVRLDTEEIRVVKAIANLTFQNTNDSGNCTALVFQIFKWEFHQASKLE